MAAALGDLGAYPDEAAAIAAVAERHGRSAEEVVLLNGASQAFWLAAALGPRRPVCVHPSFTEPEVALRAARRPPRRIVLDAPWELRAADVPDDADLVVVGNPTNPTGVLHPRHELAALCRPGRVTLVDESFMDFVPGEPETLASERALPGLVVARSLTKLHAIPGLRAGYLLAPVPLAARLRAQRPAWSVNALALAAIEAIAAHPEHAEAVALDTARARADLVARLAEVPGATVAPGRRELRARRICATAPPRRDACASRASRCARAPPSPASPPTTCASPSATRPRTSASRPRCAVSRSRSAARSLRCGSR